MIRLTALLVFLAFPLSLLAQYNHSLSDPVPNNARLFKSGNHTVLIHPMDMTNRAHKWISFDSSLEITAAKKLVMPDSENVISQTYLECTNSIIRIDQFLSDEGIQVSAYTFDMQGNILHRKEIVEGLVPARKMPPIPFYISQSPGKRTIALVQAQIVDGDSLTISGIVFNDQLTILGDGKFTVPFDQQLSDLYMPLVNDLKTIFIVTATKFDSYKLGSALTCYLLHAEKTKPQKIQFDFDRIKIKELSFYTPGDTLLFSALFSVKKNRKDVAGIMNVRYSIKEQQYLPTEEYIYNDDMVRSLKKMYGTEGRKGNLLNYLSILPDLLTANTGYSYAFLKPEHSRMKMTVYDDANANTAVRRNIAANTINGSPADISSIFSPIRSKQKSQSKNLLFFSFRDPRPETNHFFIKIKTTADPGYDFFTYFPGNNGYSALHYSSPTLGRPYLNKVTIDTAGAVIEKEIFQDGSKVLLGDYPFILGEESLLAFYKDKLTGQTGLIMVRL